MTQRRTCTFGDCNKPLKARGYCNGHYVRLMRYGAPDLGGTPKGEIPKWIDEHALFDGNECLIWPFFRNCYGYGNCQSINEENMAHRIMCSMGNGPAPTPDHEAAHSCGRGHLGCVNPKHLRWATRMENVADRIDHGTHNRGERHGLSLLTESQVQSIRSLAGKLSQSKIAEKFGVSQPLICAILNRTRWKWLD